jgi:heat shock protein HtpX
VRVDGPRAAMLTGTAVRLAVAVMPLVAVCAAVGAAVAGGGGAVAGVVVAGLVLAVVGVYCDRLALSAMLARPLSEVEHPELYRLVRELSKAGRLPVPRLFLSPAEQPNSFAVGRSPRTAAICCTEGLLAALDEAELRGVLGHELAHVSSRDILPASVSAGLATVITFPAGITRFLPAPVGSPATPVGSPTTPFGSPAAPFGSPAASGPADARGRGAAPGPAEAQAHEGAPGPAEARVREDARGPSAVGIGVLEAWLLLVLGPIAALVIRLSVAREREYRADAAGALLSGDPVALSSALRKIDAGTAELALAPDARLSSVGHLMVASPFQAEGFARLFRTQPPTGERVRRLEALAGYRR